MRTVLEFPNGFGSTSTLAQGTANTSHRTRAFSPIGQTSPDSGVTPADAGYVPGPFRADRIAGSAPMVDEDGPLANIAFVSGGFRPELVPDQVEEDEPVCREPQSVVVTAMVVGLLLAALGLLLDIR